MDAIFALSPAPPAPFGAEDDDPLRLANAEPFPARAAARDASDNAKKNIEALHTLLDTRRVYIEWERDLRRNAGLRSTIL